MISDNSYLNLHTNIIILLKIGTKEIPNYGFYVIIFAIKWYLLILFR